MILENFFRVFVCIHSLPLLLIIVRTVCPNHNRNTNDWQPGTISYSDDHLSEVPKQNGDSLVKSTLLHYPKFQWIYTRTNANLLVLCCSIPLLTYTFFTSARRFLISVKMLFNSIISVIKWSCWALVQF